MDEILVFGFFNRESDAQTVMNSLTQAGFGPENLSLIMNDIPVERIKSHEPFDEENIEVEGVYGVREPVGGTQIDAEQPNIYETNQVIVGGELQDFIGENEGDFRSRIRNIFSNLNFEETDFLAFENRIRNGEILLIVRTTEENEPEVSAFFSDNEPIFLDRVKARKN
jgi:hypothetical protein